MRRTLLAAPWCLLVFLAMPQAVDATSAIYVTPVEQARLSTAVGVATIGRSEVRVHPEWKRPITDTTVHVAEVVVGAAPETLVIEQIGGTIDNQRLVVPGDARFEVGERCLLFLRKVEGNWFLTAMEQSKYTLVETPGGTMLFRQLSGGLFVVNGQGRLEEYEEPGSLKTRSLRQMVERLRRAATEAKEEGQ